MRDSTTTNDPMTEEISTTERQFLALVEEAAAEGTITEDDRHDMSYRIEMLSAELRACAEHAD
ncbi:hypothetical protein BRC94_10820 [Halobacteriales archaeon QS_5_70_17]|jgi:hypothetical protein|nr:MAG: hypothetical protein BRC94_10820 [Halobacteriales archaeon QS_5_70_17]